MRGGQHQAGRATSCPAPRSQGGAFLGDRCPPPISSQRTRTPGRPVQTGAGAPDGPRSLLSAAAMDWSSPRSTSSRRTRAGRCRPGRPSSRTGRADTTRRCLQGDRLSPRVGTLMTRARRSRGPDPDPGHHPDLPAASDPPRRSLAQRLHQQGVPSAQRRRLRPDPGRTVGAHARLQRTPARISSTSSIRRIASCRKDAACSTRGSTRTGSGLPRGDHQPGLRPGRWPGRPPGGLDEKRGAGGERSCTMPGTLPRPRPPAAGRTGPGRATSGRWSSPGRGPDP